MQINDFLSKLKNVRKSRDGYTALCPAHSDTNPSLSVKELDDRIVIHCFAGCEFSAILKALDLQPDDLLFRKNGRYQDNTESRKPGIVAEYDYLDVSGNLLYQALRYEPKDFRLRRPDGNGGWIWSLKDNTGQLVVPLVLYRLPEVLEAIHASQQVFVTEGEKDANALRNLGLVATTNPTGAGKWLDIYSEQLEGAHVVILPDKDEPGRSHGRNVAKSLQGKAESVKTVELPGTDVKDVSDWIDHGGTRDELENLIATCGANNSRRSEKTAVVCMIDVQPEKVDFLWDPYIPRGKLTSLEGDPGIGKSWATLSIASALSIGNGLPGMGTFPPQRVLLASAEDGLGDTIRPRLDSLGAKVDNIFAIEGALTLDNDEGFTILEDHIREVQPALLGIDPLVAYMGGKVDMHRANEVRQVMAGLARIAEKYNVAILVIRHLTKGGMGRAIYRGIGSIDLTAACRSVLLAGCDPESPQQGALVHIKSNLVPLGPAVGFTLENGSFSWTGTSTLTAAQILAPNSEGSGSAIDDAIAFLKDELVDGAVPAKQVYEDAREAGISKRTLERAKARLGVKTQRQGQHGKKGGGTSTWELPQVKEDLDRQYSLLGDDGDVNPLQT